MYRNHRKTQPCNTFKGSNLPLRQSRGILGRYVSWFYLRLIYFSPVAAKVLCYLFSIYRENHADDTLVAVFGSFSVVLALNKAFCTVQCSASEQVHKNLKESTAGLPWPRGYSTPQNVMLPINWGEVAGNCYCCSGMVCVLVSGWWAIVLCITCVSTRKTRVGGFAPLSSPFHYNY